MTTTTHKLQKTSGSFFQWHSLRARATLLTLPVFVIGIGALTFYANYAQHRDMEKTLTTGTIAVGTGVASAAVAAAVAASSIRQRLPIIIDNREKLSTGKRINQGR